MFTMLMPSAHLVVEVAAWGLSGTHQGPIWRGTVATLQYWQHLTTGSMLATEQYSNTFICMLKLKFMILISPRKSLPDPFSGTNRTSLQQMGCMYIIGFTLWQPFNNFSFQRCSYSDEEAT